MQVKWSCILSKRLLKHFVYMWLKKFKLNKHTIICTSVWDGVQRSCPQSQAVAEHALRLCVRVSVTDFRMSGLRYGLSDIIPSASSAWDRASWKSHIAILQTTAKSCLIISTVWCCNMHIQTHQAHAYWRLDHHGKLRNQVQDLKSPLLCLSKSWASPWNCGLEMWHSCECDSRAVSQQV